MKYSIPFLVGTILAGNVLAGEAVIRSLKNPLLIYRISDDEISGSAQIDSSKFKVSGDTITGTTDIGSDFFVKNIKHTSFIEEKEFAFKAKMLTSMIGKNAKDWNKTGGFRDYVDFCFDDFYGKRTGEAAGERCKDRNAEICKPSKENILSCIEDRAYTNLSHFEPDIEKVINFPKGLGLEQDVKEWWGKDLVKINSVVYLEHSLPQTECSPFYNNSKEITDTEENGEFPCGLFAQMQATLNKLNESSIEGKKLDLTKGKDQKGISKFRKAIAASNSPYAPWNLPLDIYFQEILENPAVSKKVIFENQIPIVSVDESQVQSLSLKLNSLSSISDEMNVLEKLQLAQLNAKVLSDMSDEIGSKEKAKLLFKNLEMSLKGELKGDLASEKASINLLLSTKIASFATKPLTLRREVNIK